MQKKHLGSFNGVEVMNDHDFKVHILVWWPVEAALEFR